jgi:hypothetical protein
VLVKSTDACLLYRVLIAYQSKNALRNIAASRRRYGWELREIEWVTIFRRAAAGSPPNNVAPVRPAWAGNPLAGIWLYVDQWCYNNHLEAEAAGADLSEAVAKVGRVAVAADGVR